MTIDESIAEVLRLDEAATKGPWIVAGRAVSTSASNWGSVASSRHNGDLAVDIEEPDGALIARYRTLAPELARELQRMRQMLRIAVHRHAEGSAERQGADESLSGPIQEPLESADKLAADYWRLDGWMVGMEDDGADRDALWPEYRETFAARLAEGRSDAPCLSDFWVWLADGEARDATKVSARSPSEAVELWLEPHWADFGRPDRIEVLVSDGFIHGMPAKYVVEAERSIMFRATRQEKTGG